MKSGKSTKKKILAQALKMFTSKSYNKVTVADIASEVPEIHKSAIFYHFKTKLNLAHQTIIYLWKQLNPFNKEGYQKIETPLEKLGFIVDQMLTVIKDYPNLVGFFIEIIEEDKESKKSFDPMLQIFDKFGEVIVKILIECGVANPKARMLVMLSSLDGFALYGEIMRSNPKVMEMFGVNMIEEYRDELIAMVLSR